MQQDGNLNWIYIVTIYNMQIEIQMNSEKIRI